MQYIGVVLLLIVGFGIGIFTGKFNFFAGICVGSAIAIAIAQLIKWSRQ